MNQIVFTTESPSDVNKDLAEKYGFGIIPLHVNLDGVDYNDGETISAAEILDAFQTKKILPNTSAVSIAEYADFFQKYLDQGKTVIHIALSSGISSTYQNACIAASDLDSEGRLFIVDSKTLTQSAALLMYKGAALAEEGMAATDIIRALEDLIPKLEKTFLIPSLEFMHHGGRCSSTEALGANLLKIKPLIELVDGKMAIAQKFRGADLKAYKDYLDSRLTDVEVDPEYLCISHVLVDDSVLSELVTYAKKTYHFEQVVISPCGCVITAHGGKGALAFSFLKA